MKQTKGRAWAALIIHALDPVLVALAVSFFFTRDTLSVLGVEGATCFRYFTIDANILAAVSCLAMIPFDIRALSGSTAPIPGWVTKLRYAGTVVVTLTLLVVLCYLMPVQGVTMMTASSNLYLHLICPPLVIAAYLLLESGKLSKRDALIGVLTVLVYAALYLVMVVALGVWPDFYNFNDNNTWPFFFAGIMVFTYLVSRLVTFLGNKIRK